MSQKDPLRGKLFYFYYKNIHKVENGTKIVQPFGSKTGPKIVQPYDYWAKTFLAETDELGPDLVGQLLQAQPSRREHRV